MIYGVECFSSIILTYKLVSAENCHKKTSLSLVGFEKDEQLRIQTGTDHMDQFNVFLFEIYLSFAGSK